MITQIGGHTKSHQEPSRCRPVRQMLSG